MCAHALGVEVAGSTYDPFDFSAVANTWGIIVDILHTHKPRQAGRHAYMSLI